MEKSELSILVVDRLPRLEGMSPLKIFQIFRNSKFIYDFVIIPHIYNKGMFYRVEVFLFKTLNTKQKHDGQWRYILSLQGKEYEHEQIKFSYFDIPDINLDILLSNLGKYFDINRFNESF
ncbi:MAG: hypothetical protein JJE53_01780 [Candidatus Pacebacteria bacterium]|nr:hypothetical protein [Candidatus Paceibacterota bacterium]